MGVRPGMSWLICVAEMAVHAPLARIVDSVYAIDIDPAMLDRARRLLLQLVRPIAIFRGGRYDFRSVVPEPVDYVFLANTFHASRSAGLGANRRCNPQTGRAIRGRQLHRRPREETLVFGQPRGPRPRCGWKPAMSR